MGKQSRLLLVGFPAHGACRQELRHYRLRAYRLRCRQDSPCFRDEGVEKSDIDGVFRTCDVVSLHCPLTDGTYHLVDSRRLSLMKPDAIVINTGRGPLVDEDALAEALKEKRIRAAGVDVLSSEPPAPGNPLLSAPGCYITPHVSWATTEARIRLMHIAAENLKAFIEGKPRNVVNGI